MTPPDPADHYDLAAKIAWSYKTPHLDFDDRLQICLLALVKAAKGFSRKKGYSFRRYASTAMYHALHKAMPKQARSLELQEERAADPRQAQDHATQTDTALDIQSALHVLSQKECAVIVARYGLNGNDPQKQTEIAAVLGISRQGISWLELQALRKLRKEMEKNGT